MKNIFILISLLYNVSLAIAQTNYYTTTKTFNEQGYIYQCDVDTESGDINLKIIPPYTLKIRMRLIMTLFSK